MFTCLFRTSIKFGRVPREHRPLQQQQQHRSQAIIPPSSRPGVKKKKKEQGASRCRPQHRAIWKSGSCSHHFTVLFFFQGDDIYCCFAAAVAVLFWTTGGFIGCRLIRHGRQSNLLLYVVAVSLASAFQRVRGNTQL